jgi:hypothetical protein
LRPPLDISSIVSAADVNTASALMM